MVEKPLGVVALAVAALGLGAGAPRVAGAATLMANGENQVVDCQGGVAALTGSGNHVTFRGGCSGLDLNGDGNAVEIELQPGAPVHIVGHGDHVLFRTVGGNLAPTVTMTGGDNQITRWGGTAQDAGALPDARIVTQPGAPPPPPGPGGAAATVAPGGTAIVEMPRGAPPPPPPLYSPTPPPPPGAGAEPPPRAEVQPGPGGVTVQQPAGSTTIVELRRELGARETPEGTLVQLPDDVLFDFDSTRLRPSAQVTLGKLAALISASHPSGLRIVGYTDSIGTLEYNMGLSTRRAQSVEQWLASAGVPMGSASVEGRGPQDPVAPNTLPDGRDNPAGRQANRRVDVLMQR